MTWKSLFGRHDAGRAHSQNDLNSHQALLAEPRQLLQLHRHRLTALRLESGYDSEHFERLIGAIVYQIAAYVHLLPATRAETHVEAGGLLRLAIETACFAFRRADGKLLAGPVSTDIRNRERDRVWRYTAFLGGLLRPLGRCATSMRVAVPDRELVWNPYQEPLWVWMRRVDAARLEVIWRDRTDARPVQESSIWIAARVATPAALSYLQSADEVLPELLLKLLNGNRAERVCEVVEEAYQAAIDQDLARTGTSGEAPVTGVQIEHRLLEALRALVREKWTLNTPGGRLWLTTQGVFVVWKPAVNDLVVRLRADGASGAPRDPDTIAELLIAHGVLVPNPAAASALKHYFKITPQMRGAPKQGLEVVKIADVELLGLRTEGVDAIEADIIGASKNGPAAVNGKDPAPQVLELPLDTRSRDIDRASESTGTAREAAAGAPERSLVTALVGPATQAPADLGRLKRFGEAGVVLRALGERLMADPGFARIVRLAEGVAIAYPEAIAPFCERPQAFLAACETQGLLVLDPVAGRRVLRARTTGQTHLPEQYVVLSPRVAKYLPVPVER